MRATVGAAIRGDARMSGGDSGREESPPGAECPARWPLAKALGVRLPDARGRCRRAVRASARPRRRVPHRQQAGDGQGQVASRTGSTGCHGPEEVHGGRAVLPRFRRPCRTRLSRWRRDANGLGRRCTQNPQPASAPSPLAAWRRWPASCCGAMLPGSPAASERLEWTRWRRSPARPQPASFSTSLAESSNTSSWTECFAR